MVANAPGPKQRPSGMQSFLSLPSPPCLCEKRVCLAVRSAGCWQRVSLQVMQSSHSQNTGCRASGASLLMLLPLALSLAWIPLSYSCMTHAPLPFLWPGLSLPQHCPLPLNLLPWNIPFSMTVLCKYWRQQKRFQLADRF